MKLIEKIKLITQTLMVVVIVAFGFGMYHLYQNGASQCTRTRNKRNC